MNPLLIPILVTGLIIALGITGFAFARQTKRCSIDTERYAHYLIDGPVLPAPERRRLTIEAMADELAKADLIPDREDAMRILRAAGYSSFDVCRHVDDAQALAFQAIVAREMSAS